MSEGRYTRPPDEVHVEENGCGVPESGVRSVRGPQHQEEGNNRCKEEGEWLKNLKEKALEAVLQGLAGQIKDAGPTTKASLQERLVSQNAGEEMTSLLSEFVAEEMVRAITLSALRLPGVIQSTSSLVRWLVHDQLFVNKYFDWTEERTAQLLYWSLAHPYVRSTTTWLVDGLLLPGGVTDEPAITSTLVSLPWSKPSIESGLTWGVLEALKWGGNRNMAKEAFIVMLRSDRAQAAALTAAEEELKRKK